MEEVQETRSQLKNEEQKYVPVDQMEMTTEQKIEKVIQKLKEKSENTRSNQNIFQILTDLADLLNEFEDVKNTITDNQSHTLYIQFHKFIKSKQEKETQLSACSAEAWNTKDESKLNSIKLELLEMMESAQILYKQVFQESQKHILWMDKKQDNNFQELYALEKTYSNKVKIKQYAKDEEFREDLTKLKDYPLILIMSASAAGANIEYGDGNHLQYILSIKNTLRLRGIIFFCSKEEEKSMKELKNNPDNTIYSVVTERQLLLEHIERLIVPLDFKRVVPLSHLDYYLSKKIKEKLLNWSSQDWSQYKLLGYKTKSYEKMFSRAKKIIVEKKINILNSVINQMETIPSKIEYIFQENNTEESLSFEFMRFYTNQNSACHNFLNSVLNVMNDDLIFILLDFINLFLISLYRYDDTNETIIQKTNSGLNSDDLPIYEFYRGTSIPTDFINNNELVPGQFITLPSFSSFTTKYQVAKKFMFYQQKFGDCTLLILYFQFQTGTKYYDSRPKCIKRASNYGSEDEYLFYPFTNFCISSVEKKQEISADYLFVELSVN